MLHCWIVSGFSEREAVFRTIGPAHQYYVKPCQSQILVDAIRRALGVRRRLQSPLLLALVAGAKSVPALPTALMALFDELQSPNGSAGEVARIISADVGLMVNAAHAIEGSGKDYPGTITVETWAGDGFVEVTVSDSGTGVPEDIKSRIFDPLFTTKDVGKGTGQGLAICYDVVVTKHGGQITVGGVPGEGAVFTVRLPLSKT